MFPKITIGLLNLSKLNENLNFLKNIILPLYKISNQSLNVKYHIQSFKYLESCKILVLILAIQNYAKWSLIPNHTLPNDFNHAIPLKITQGIQIHQWFIQKPSQTS